MNFSLLTSALFVILSVGRSTSIAESQAYHQMDTSDLSTQCHGNQLCSPRECQLTGAFKPSSQLYFKCDCHIDCYKRGTCCINFEEICLSGSYLSMLDECLNLEEILEAAKRKDESKQRFAEFTALRQKRITLKKVTDETNDFNMVFRCPACTDSPPDLVAKCQLDVWHDLKQLAAVMSGGTLYRNEYCLECHRRTSNASLAVEPVRTEIHCTNQENVEEKAFNYYQNNDIKGIFEMVLKGECSEFYPSINPERVPVEERFGTDSCPVENAMMLPNYQEISTACSSYAAYVYVASLIPREKPRPYKNKHCLLCNNLDDLRYAEPHRCICLTAAPHDESYCSRVARGKYVTLEYNILFNVALDFTRKPSLKPASVKSCNDQTEEANLVNWTCERRVCPQDYVVVGLTCLHTSHVQLVALDTQSRPSFEICAGLISNHTIDITNPDFSRRLSNILLWKSNAPEDRHTPGFEGRPTIGLSSEQPCFNVSRSHMLGVRMSADPVSFIKEYYSIILMNAVSDFTVIMGNLAQMQIESMSIVMNSNMICPDDYQKTIVVDPALVWTGVSGELFRDIEFLLKSYAKFYDRESGLKAEPTRQRWALELSKKGNSWEYTLLWEVCIKVDAECFNGSTGANCTRTQRIAQESQRIGTNQSVPQWEAWLNLFLSITSILSHAATICVHVLFPSIMKSGGRTFMSLIACLLGANICMLLSGFRIWSPVVCSVLAMLQHLTWLSAFSWTAMMSWNLFLALTQLKSGATGDAKWTIYCLVGWGIPLLVVAACICLHFSGLFQYGSETMCWISDPFQLGLSFALPVALVVSFNGVLYAVTAAKLRSRLMESERLGTNIDMKSKLFLYIKLSSVIGFPWLFGFLANIEGLSFLKYAFSITAALNGSFVAICFTWNSRSIRTMRLGVQTRSG